MSGMSRRIAQTVVVGIGMAVAVVGIFAALNGFKPCVRPLCDQGGERQSGRCGEARTAYNRYAADAVAARDATDRASSNGDYVARNTQYERWRSSARLVVAVIEQNASCFSVEERANGDLLKARIEGR